MPSVALLAATVANGNTDKVKQFLVDGVDANTRDMRGTPLLHWAATNGHVGVAAALIKAGADVNAVNLERHTALHVAVEGGARCNGVVELLVGKRADVHAKDEILNTPLVNAARKGTREAAAQLLLAGADKNYVVGRLAVLQWAAISWNKPVYELLKLKGAKPVAQFNEVTKEDEFPHAEFPPQE
eukprot:7378092-Prymnesium_polylepis.2